MSWKKPIDCWLGTAWGWVNDDISPVTKSESLAWLSDLWNISEWAPPVNSADPVTSVGKECTTIQTYTNSSYIILSHMFYAGYDTLLQMLFGHKLPCFDCKCLNMPMYLFSRHYEFLVSVNWIDCRRHIIPQRQWWSVTKYNYFVTVLKYIFQVSVLYWSSFILSNFYFYFTTFQSIRSYFLLHYIS